MDRDTDSLYLLDMTACTPSSAITEDYAIGSWVSVDYEIDAGPGRMLFCGPDSQAPPLSLALPAQGWHHIFVATYRQPHVPDTCLRLKLASDAAYTRAVAETVRPDKDLVSADFVPGPADLCEAYWRSVDLPPGEQILFHRPLSGSMAQTMTSIAYVRLVPVSDAERHWLEAAPQTQHRRLIANYDGGQHHMWAYAAEDEVREEFHALADSDFGIALWGVARSFATFYPSRVATEADWAAGMPGVMRDALQARARRRTHGFDPLRAAVTCAREIGVALYPQMRMSGEMLPPNHLHYGGPGAFQRDHPEWRCRTAEGHPTRHLSQAFPEVRDEYLRLFREWVEDYEADGVCIVFCRSWPYVLYEQPVLGAFDDTYGQDMRDLDPFDEGVLAHRASFLTQLLRQIRAMLDEVGDAQGRRLGTCYIVPATGYTPAGCPDLGPFTSPRSRAMDVEAWVREGLVDELVVHIEQVGEPDGSSAPPVLQPYVELARDTPTRITADLYPRRQSADSMRVRALACYAAGVDGLCFWDCQGRALRLSGWAMHRRLGHRDELPGLQDWAESLYRCVPMSSLAGFPMGTEYSLPTDG